MKNLYIITCLCLFFITNANSQTLSALQQQNARATGYAIVAARNPGRSFSVFMIKWDGINTLEDNANNQINPLWHAQAAVKGNFFDQTFVDNNFSTYSSVVISQSEFDTYKSTGSDWWIVCSFLPPFSNSGISTLENGNVGIGILSPKNKLDVKGTIHSQEVKVDMTGWSDFVFKKEYDLPTLEKVEKHIAEKGHLENIPSEKEVLENGINLGEMNAKLLQKIEELTLYIIQQENNNNKQSEEIDLLKKENQKFQSILERVVKLENQSK
ncbi:hypothetical protein [Flavobacterium sp. N1736]|uniref:hypothetical protein n=1 Tax=Flavobacterium sp. N1736 TaxID=2986823 RepID=UPI002224F9E2|nr:hypothetical protein [Flavobacterium sp. N1736]